MKRAWWVRAGWLVRGCKDRGCHGQETLRAPHERICRDALSLRSLPRVLARLLVYQPVRFRNYFYASPSKAAAVARCVYMRAYIERIGDVAKVHLATSSILELCNLANLARRRQENPSASWIIPPGTSTSRLRDAIRFFFRSSSRRYLLRDASLRFFVSSRMAKLSCMRVITPLTFEIPHVETATMIDVCFYFGNRFGNLIDILLQ